MVNKILVSGIGNIFLGDDGFGVEVAKRMLQRARPDNVEVVDFGIRGYDLAFALMEPWDAVILADAMQRGGSPGTVYVVAPDLEALNATSADLMAFDAHSMHPLNVLRMVKDMGGVVPPTTLVACEPLDLGGEEGRLGLSSEVEAAVDVAIERIDQLLKDLDALQTGQRATEVSRVREV